MTISYASQLSFEIPEQPFVADTYGLVPTKIRTKFCISCRQELPRSEFRGKLHGSSITRTYCKKCSTVTQKNWVENNRARHNAGVRKRYIADPDTTTVRVMNARARKNKFVGTVTVAQWKEVKSLYGGRCAYCGISSLSLQMDHLWPLSLANKNLEVSEFATNDVENIVPACVWCNQAKQDRSFIIMLGWKNGLLT